LSFGAQSYEDNVTFSSTPLYVAQRGNQAQQHALVIGINHYKHTDGFYLTKLLFRIRLTIPLFEV
jgi:hypothetical protein